MSLVTADGTPENRRGLLRQVSRAIHLFNLYRTPEITARVTKLDRSVLEVEFRGTSCRSCGSYDYLEDFQFDASDILGRRVELLGFDDFPEGLRARYAIGPETVFRLDGVRAHAGEG